MYIRFPPIRNLSLTVDPKQQSRPQEIVEPKETKGTFRQDTKSDPGRQRYLVTRLEMIDVYGRIFT